MGDAVDRATLHVRTETRTVYVSARGARLTKRGAYNAAAAALIAARCDCGHGICDAQQGCQCQQHTCRYHDFEEATGETYRARLLPRLVKFLKFVDGKVVHGGK